VKSDELFVLQHQIDELKKKILKQNSVLEQKSNAIQNLENNLGRIKQVVVEKDQLIHNLMNRIKEGKDKEILAEKERNKQIILEKRKK